MTPGCFFTDRSPHWSALTLPPQKFRENSLCHFCDYHYVKVYSDQEKKQNQTQNKHRTYTREENTMKKMITAIIAALTISAVER